MSQLLLETKNLVKKEKHLTFLILNNLKKIEDEKLYCDLGYSSLHGYLEHELGYSSAEAALRVANVKLLKIAPIVKEKMEFGNLNLTQGGSLFQAISKNTQDSKAQTMIKVEETLALIDGKSTRETDKIISQIFNCQPKMINKVIISERLNEKLERLKKIYGDKSHEELFEILVDEKLMEQKIHSESAQKNEHIKNIEAPKSRYIPVSVKRAVVTRAQKQCEFKSSEGVRCCERRNLEFEHVHAYSLGGAHSVANLKLFCKNHNTRSSIVLMPHKVFPHRNR